MARVTVQSLRRPDDRLQSVHKTFRVKLHLLGATVDLGIHLDHMPASRHGLINLTHHAGMSHARCWSETGIELQLIQQAACRPALVQIPVCRKIAAGKPLMMKQ